MLYTLLGDLRTLLAVYGFNLLMVVIMGVWTLLIISGSVFTTMHITWKRIRRFLPVHIQLQLNEADSKIEKQAQIIIELEDKIFERDEHITEMSTALRAGVVQMHKADEIFHFAKIRDIKR